MLSLLPYYGLFAVVMVFGTVFSLSSVHWLTMWLGMELNTICFLPIMLRRGSVSESESAMKYYIFQSVGSTLYMLGSLMAGPLAMTYEVGGSSLGKNIVILGLLLKLGAAPLHFWFPGVLSGLSWSSAFLLMTWQKVAPLFLMSTVSMDKSMLVYMSAAMSSLVGGIGGINQTMIRPVLAYSSINHVGWMLASFSGGMPVSVTYFIIYAISSYMVFYTLWYLNQDSYSSLSAGKVSVEGGLFMLLLLSLGGLPPLLGFYPKVVVILALVSQSGNWVLFIALMVGSVLSVYYYLSLAIAMLLAMKDMRVKSLNSLPPFYLPIFLIINMVGIMLILTL